MAGEHIKLRFGERNGKPQVEPVHAERLDGTRLRLLYSPGWVYGIAAGDEFELTDDQGSFRVLQRGGNVVVRVFSEAPVSGFADLLVADVSRLGGYLDGGIERAMTFTIPISASLDAIDDAFTRFCTKTPGLVWEYGNVYDDDGSPLNWWTESGA